ncbi:MAG: capsular polysaccharide synthesis protein [Steroidobacteraceae bacterium]
MRKIIWTCWFQGRQAAPEIVRKCVQSWEDRNPGWDVRCLDASTVSKYVDLSPYIDLTQQTVTAASLSDILRVLLLHEYGGVWVDATAFCNVPLDDWLPLAADTGFFAFAFRGLEHPLGTWFLAAEPGNSLLAKWAAHAMRYWHRRERTDEYFWLRLQFGELCASDKQALRAWQDVPRISAAEPPHTIQLWMYEDYNAVKSRIDWTVPVFKLTHRLDASLLTPNCLIARLLDLSKSDAMPPSSERREPLAAARPIGLLKYWVTNLGDNIQIIAAENLLRRAGLVPSFFADMTEGLAQPPPVSGELAPGIVLNGWFDTHWRWPPHSAYRPLYLGFHIGYHEPTLISPAALDHYAAHGPIGCRDRYTLSVLRSYGVEAFLSHCLTLTFARRLPDPDRQKEVFVVSRDRWILNYLPSSLGSYTFISHYDYSDPEPYEFEKHKRQAAELLKAYRDRAKLIVTTLLHCALPAAAMGIPVVVFYPPDEGRGREQFDLARLSSLAELVRVFWVSEAAHVDWQGYTPDVSALKLKLVDTFFTMAARWGRLAPPALGPIAPPSALPPPFDGYMHHYVDGPDRFAELPRMKSPDRQKWEPPWTHNPAKLHPGDLRYSTATRPSFPYPDERPNPRHDQTPGGGDGEVQTVET